MSTIVPGGLFVTADEAAWLVRALAERRLENGQPAGLLATLREAAAGADSPSQGDDTTKIWMEYQHLQEVGLPRRRSPNSGPLPRSAFAPGAQ